MPAAVAAGKRVAAALVEVSAPAAPQMRDTQGNPGPRPILLHCPNWPLASAAAAAALAALAGEAGAAAGAVLAAALAAEATAATAAEVAALAVLAAALALAALAAEVLAGVALALVKVAAAMGTRAAEALPPALAVALATAKIKRSTGRENRLAKQHVAPMGKRGRWGGINSTTVRTATGGSISQKPYGLECQETRGGAG